MDKNNNFIVTTSIETYETLIKLGFDLVCEQNGVFTFLNNSKLSFSNLKDITYTNKLTF